MADTSFVEGEPIVLVSVDKLQDAATPLQGVAIQESIVLRHCKGLPLKALYAFRKRYQRHKLCVFAENPLDLQLLIVFSFLFLPKKRLFLIEKDQLVFLGFSKIMLALLKTLLYSFRNLFFLGSTLLVLGVVSMLKKPVYPQKSLRHLVYLKSNLSYSSFVGGSVSHARGMINAFSEKGIQVNVFCSHDLGEIKGASFKKMLPPLGGVGFPYDLNHIYYSVVVVFHVLRKVFGTKVDAVYYRDTVYNLSGLLLAVLLRKPLLVEFNGSEIWAHAQWGKKISPFFQWIAKKIEQHTLLYAQKVVTISSANQQYLLESGVPLERICVYPNGVDEKCFTSERFSQKEGLDLRTALGIPLGAVVAMFVGTFGRWHGTEVIAEALYALSEKSDLGNLYTVFVGDGVQRKAVQAFLEEKGLKERVLFTGIVPQEETPRYLAIADICLAPTKSNPDGSAFFGSPTKLFEYMAMGKALITTKVGDIPQMFEGTQRIAACLIAPDSSQALAVSLKQLAEDETLRAGLGLAARELVQARYTWRHHVEAVLKI